MKKFFAIFSLLAVLLAAYPFFNQSEEAKPLVGLPWQIDQLEDGSTKVFGLQLSKSRLSDALAIIGEDVELAIVVATESISKDTDHESSSLQEKTVQKEIAQKETGSLEMYYGHYRAGLLSGKLILQAESTKQKITRWRNNAVKYDYMATGLAKKYFLSAEDLPEATNEVIVGITFIPAVNLDEEVIVARFGEPAERIEGDAVVHYLYPDKGLDIAYYASSKEVLQYVAPKSFNKLVQPLR